MKKYLLLLVVCIVAQQSSCAQTSTEQWREDLQFLKQTIHTKYPNLFYNVSARQFDSAADDIVRRIPSLQEYEFQADIGRLMNMFRIGHTQAGYLFPAGGGAHSAEAAKERLFPMLPVEFYVFSDGLYIKAAQERLAELVGAKILQIGDVQTAEALEKIKPFVNYENDFGFLSNAPFILRFPKLLKVAGITKETEQLRIQYEKNGVTKEITLSVDKAELLAFQMTGLEARSGWTDANKNAKNPLPYWRQKGGAFRNMIYLPESKICYIRHSVTLNEQQETIKKFFTEAYDFIEKNDVEKLVLDVRMNGGGNNTLNKPIITGIIGLKKINQKGKFFCITGRRTFSACQNLVNELEKFTEVTFVGEPTAENVNFYGDTKTETLPNTKIRVFCSWLWWQNSDPRDKRKATQPHLSVDMTFAEYANNIDPVMNVITNYTPESPIGEIIKTLVLQNNPKEAFAKAEAYLKNPVNKYYRDRMESGINDTGYGLLNDGKMQEAKNIFEMNIRLFPASGNAYDSFAECYLKMGLHKEAKEYYQKAVQVEPDYPNASEAKKIIADLSH